MLRRFFLSGPALFALAVLAALAFPGSASAQSVSLSVNPSSITEEGGTQKVTVTAVTTVGQPYFCINVDVGAHNASKQTATEGTDYAGVSHKLVQFNFGTTVTTTFDVTPTDDSVSDGGETIQVHSWKPSDSCKPNFNLSYGSTNLTLNDSDPKANLSVSPTEINENAGATVVTVTAALNLQGTRTLGSALAYTVSAGKTGDSATKDTDYTAGSLTVTLPSGTANVQATGTFTLTPERDALEESDETITVRGVSTNDGDAGEASITLKNWVFDPCHSQSTTDLLDDCQALEVFYDDAGGTNWKNSANWKIDDSLDQWYGIKVSGGRVTEIKLDGNQLTGTISPSILALTELNGLYLEDNSLSGTIPNDLLWFLTKLNGLYLSNNRLSGEIPYLNSATSLSVLYLDGNNLSGGIPDLSDLDHLTVMDLSENSLSGSVPDMSSTRMHRLYLSDNQLTRTFSASSLPEHVCVVDLSNNRLSGTIPDLSSLTSLCELNLKGNSYSGTISASLFPSGGRRGVQLIDLSNNSLSGTIPDMSSTGVTYLYLSNNDFGGTINPSFGSDNGLRDLDLSNNNLSGTIPPITSGGLNYLLLQNNNLSGTIPDLSSSSYLAALGLWGNSGLTGDITVHSSVNLGQAGDRSALWVLYEATDGKNWKNAATNGWFTSYMSNWQGVTLSNGRVTGLDLSGNGLTGNVGNSLQVLSVLTTLDLSCNSSLTGQLPLELKDIDTLTSVNICSTGVSSPGDQSFTDWKNGSDVTFTDGTCSPACPQSASQQSVSPQSSPPPPSPESSPPAEGVGGGNGENEAENVPEPDPAVPSGEGDSGEGDIEAGGGCALVSGTQKPLGAAFSLFLAASVLLVVSRAGRRSG